MRYLPSLGVGNTQLIKGKKKKGISKPFPKKKKKKEKPNLRLNTEKRKSAAADAKVVSQSGIGMLSGWGLGAGGLSRRDLRG